MRNDRCSRAVGEPRTASLPFFSLAGLMSGGVCTSIDMQTDDSGCFYIHLWLTVGTKMSPVQVHPVPL